MNAWAKLQVIGQYGRDVLGRHFLRRPPHNVRTYLSLRELPDRYHLLLPRYLSSPAHPLQIITSSPSIISLRTYGKQLDHLARLAYRCDDVYFSPKIPSSTHNATLVHDGSNPALLERPWRKIVHLDFDIAQPPPLDQPWLILPYQMHPFVYTRHQERHIPHWRQAARPIRLFFAGHWEQHAYATAPSILSLRERFGLFDRHTLIQALLDGLQDRLVEIRTMQDFQRLLHGDYSDRCVIALNVGFLECRIPQQRWLEVLGRCDAFIAVPGTNTPLCHNLIEAMAVGTIPLTNYAPWLTPALQDGHNCLTFQTPAQLVTAAWTLLNMEPSTLATMRHNVLTYHDHHLARSAFLDRLLHHPAPELKLFVSTDDIPTWQRVNTSSVIIAGKYHPAPALTS